MDRVVEAVLKLVVRGSDELVIAVYRRLCADRSAACGAPPGSPGSMTWRELAGLAVAERALTGDEAQCLRLMEGCGTPPLRRDRSAGRWAP